MFYSNVESRHHYQYVYHSSIQFYSYKYSKHLLFTTMNAHIHTIVQVGTKASVAQSILLYEGIKPLLDQLANGLQCCGVLKMMRNFPDLFIPFFVHTGDISCNDVCEAICSESTNVVVEHLFTSIREMDKDGE